MQGFSAVDYTVNTKTAMPIRSVSPSARFNENGHYMVVPAEVASREETSLSVNMTYDREHYATEIIGDAKKNSATLYQIERDTKANKLRTLISDLAVEFTPASASASDNGLSISSSKSKDYDMRLAEEVLNENRETRTMSASYKYSYHGSKLKDEREKSLGVNSESKYSLPV